MLTEVAGEIVLPTIMATMIDEGIANGNIPYVISRMAIMFGCICIMIIGGLGGHYLSVSAAVSFSADIRKDVFKKVQEFSFKNIDTFSTGSLVTRLTNDITQIQNITRMFLIMAMRSPGMLIGGIIMALRLNSSLAAILIIVIPLLGAAIGALMYTAYPRFNVVQKKLDGLNSGIQENITNVRVIKSFVREKFEIDKFRRANTDLKDSTLNAMKIVICTMPVMTLAMNITMIVTVWNGGNLVVGGGMEVGDLTAFTTYIVQILMSLMMVAMTFMTIVMLFLQSSRAAASSKRIKEVLNTVVDLTDDNAANKDLTVERGEVEFRNVCFKYYESRKDNILNNISFKINPGETIGIIGATGSGKTSLVQLIPRLYDVTEGEVLVDGVNVKDYSIRHLRDGVGMVLQKNVLFSGSIEDNLRWGDADASREEIGQAADNAQADGFVKSFTDGYNTELGQGGVNVSGGQKQRLCIARALLKKPKILILDDSTSAVDTATEAKIRHAFATTLKDTTKIIIAQRISSISDADKILVLSEGNVTGFGTHDELMQTNEEYRDIYRSQIDEEVTA